jgi:hypothetical protein
MEISIRIMRWWSGGQCQDYEFTVRITSLESVSGL